jgi:hypothetical protein
LKNRFPASRAATEPAGIAVLDNGSLTAVGWCRSMVWVVDDAYRTVADAAASTDPTPAQLLAALSLIGVLRSDLDQFERRLIESAREREVGWQQISTALGLSSRQAAEQRWLRLCGESGRDPAQVRAARSRQRMIDTTYGPEIGELRSATAAAHRRICADAGWDERHPLAVLARMSLETASGAEPGALYSLAYKAMGDLDGMRAGRLPVPLGPAVRRLRRALDSASPSPRR